MKSIAIVRVSSDKQGLQGDSTDDQLDAIKMLAKKNGDDITKRYKWIESGSVDIEKQPAWVAIDYCRKHSEIKRCYIKCIDRFTRAGLKAYILLQDELRGLGVNLLDVDGVIDNREVNSLSHLGKKYKWSVSRPSQIQEYLTAENAKQEVSTILKRMIGAEIRYARAGYAIGVAQYGYMNAAVETNDDGTRKVKIPNPSEAPFVVRMFELMAEGKSSEEVVSELNKMGFKTRNRNKRKRLENGVKKKVGILPGIELSEKQLMRYIQNPVYAGVSTHSFLSWVDEEKELEHFEPVFNKGEALVSIELWNRANKRKKIVVDDAGDIQILEGKKLERYTKKTKEDKRWPYKRYFLCQKCGHEMKASASKGKNRHIPAYHCSLGHSRVSINAKQFHQEIEDFVKRVRFSDTFIERFREILLEEWEKRRDGASKDSIQLERSVLDIKEEQRIILEKIKASSSHVVTKALEEDYEKLEKKRTEAISFRNNKEDEEVDIQTVISYCYFWMEHLEELLLDSDKPLESARLFSLVFEEMPTLAGFRKLAGFLPETEIDGTPKLSCLFVLNQQEAAVVEPNGEPGGTRTHDTQIKSLLL